MEHTLIALLVVNIVLAAGVAGSILHESGVPYPQLLPYQVTYSNAHSPVLVSQPLGLSIESALAAAGYVAAPAPVVEEDSSLEEASGNRSAAQGEPQEVSSNQLVAEPSPSSAPESHLSASVLPLRVPISLGDIVSPLTVPELSLSAVESHSTAPTTVGEPPSSSIGSESSPALAAESPLTPPTAPPATSSESASVAGSELVSPSTAPDASSQAAESALTAPSPSAGAPRADVKLLDGITGGALYIDAGGKIQMQASYVSGGEGLPVATVDIPQPTDAVPVVISELPVITAVKTPKSKGVANVNVNVNVNVNGDGTGSAYNTSSIAEINAPIDASHKCQ